MEMVTEDKLNLIVSEVFRQTNQFLKWESENWELVLENEKNLFELLKNIDTTLGYLRKHLEKYKDFPVLESISETKKRQIQLKEMKKQLSKIFNKILKQKL